MSARTLVNIAASELLGQQALAIAERKLGSDHPHTISLREGLENMRQKKRDFYGE